MCCRDHKRHDNLTDISICPKTGVKPRKIELADLTEDTEQRELLIVASLKTVCDAVYVTKLDVINR